MEESGLENVRFWIGLVVIGILVVAAIYFIFRAFSHSSTKLTNPPTQNGQEVFPVYATSTPTPMVTPFPTSATSQPQQTIWYYPTGSQSQSSSQTSQNQSQSQSANGVSQNQSQSQ